MGIGAIVWVGPILVVGTILVLVAGRRDTDDAGLRTPARYVAAACLVATFLTLFGAFGVVSQLSKFLISNDHGGFSDIAPDLGAFVGGMGGGRESDDALWRSAVQLGLLTAASAGVLVFHRRYRRSLLATGSSDRAVVRVDHAYLYVVCFLAVFVVLFAAYSGVYGLFRVVAPGVTSFEGGSGERERGIAQVISFVALALGALLVFTVHWRDTPRRGRTVDAPPPIPTT